MIISGSVMSFHYAPQRMFVTNHIVSVFSDTNSYIKQKDCIEMKIKISLIRALPPWAGDDAFWNLCSSDSGWSCSIEFLHILTQAWAGLGCKSWRSLPLYSIKQIIIVIHCGKKLILSLFVQALMDLLAPAVGEPHCDAVGQDVLDGWVVGGRQ